jgi:prevent-host-death family protein
MAVTVRELAHRTREVLREVERDRRKILVTSNGRPVAVLVPIDEEELLDRALEALIPSEEQVSREIMEGKTRSLSEVAKELGL